MTHAERLKRELTELAAAAAAVVSAWVSENCRTLDGAVTDLRAHLGRRDLFADCPMWGELTDDEANAIADTFLDLPPIPAGECDRIVAGILSGEITGRSLPELLEYRCAACRKEYSYSIDELPDDLACWACNGPVTRHFRSDQ